MEKFGELTHSLSVSDHKYQIPNTVLNTEKRTTRKSKKEKGKRKKEKRKSARFGVAKKLKNSKTRNSLLRCTHMHTHELHNFATTTRELQTTNDDCAAVVLLCHLPF